MTIIHAPLVVTGLELEAGQWYDIEVIKQKIANVKFDVVLVDSPPAYTEDLKHSRYPAAIFLQKGFLQKDYTIILDDIDRQGEQKVVEKWETHLGIKFEQRLANGSVAIGRSKTGFGI